MTSTQDISGYRIFDGGDVGSAHVLAHRMLDSGQFELGHRQLGEWLEGREGSGSDWVHIQWHMMVFELAVGRWTDAHQRFMTHVLPNVELAATDAPAGLWRLLLASPRPVQLPWGTVAAQASATIDQSSDPFVVLHQILALAGAGDVAALDDWLAGARGDGADPSLRTLAEGLRAFTVGDFAAADASFTAGLPGLPSLGGSRAQNELFADIHRLAVDRLDMAAPRAA